MMRKLYAALILSYAMAGYAEEIPGPAAGVPAQETLQRTERFDMPVPPPPQFQPAQENPEMIKAAYLGVTASPTPDVPQQQFGVPAGVGLIIEDVAKDSPAEMSGLRNGDFLHKLNDQLLINPEQLDVLVRTFKPGNTITLSVIRQGRPLALTATLVDKEMPKVIRGSVTISTLPMPGMPDIQGVVVPNIVVPALPAIPNMPDAPNVQQFQRNFHAARMMNDGEHSFSVTEDPNGKRAEIRDKDGRLLFQGTINTPEELQKVPEQFRGKIQELGKGSPTEVRIFGSAVIEPAPPPPAGN